jgi:hypothetical protein
MSKIDGKLATTEPKDLVGAPFSLFVLASHKETRP